jgi:predicted  nucleic acid-binding Zn-ribbon protein
MRTRNDIKGSTHTTTKPPWAHTAEDEARWAQGEIERLKALREALEEALDDNPEKITKHLKAVDARLASLEEML